MYALIHHYYCLLFTGGDGIINHRSGCFFNLGNTVNRIYKWISSFSESSYIYIHVSALITPYLYHTWYCIILDLRDVVLHTHRVRDSQWKQWGLASCQGLQVASPHRPTSFWRPRPHQPQGSQGPLWAGRVPHSARSTPGEEHLKVFLWFTAPGHGRSVGPLSRYQG